jgi:E3 ubiquitin-protein ligase DOA10
MDDTECLICLEELDNSSIAKLSCNHRYHYSCLQAWIRKTKHKYKICTICNTDVEITNIYNENNEPTEDIPINNNLSNKIEVDESGASNKWMNCCTIL